MASHGLLGEMVVATATLGGRNELCKPRGWFCGGALEDFEGDRNDLP